MQTLKKIFLLLLLISSSLQAECNVLGFMLNYTTMQDITRKHHFIKKSLGDIIYHVLDPNDFGINGLQSIDLEFDNYDVLTSTTLHFPVNDFYYQQIKQILDKKYSLNEDISRETKRGGLFKEKKILGAFRVYETKNCEIILHYDKIISPILRVWYRYIHNEISTPIERML